MQFSTPYHMVASVMLYEVVFIYYFGVGQTFQQPIKIFQTCGYKSNHYHGLGEQNTGHHAKEKKKTFSETGVQSDHAFCLGSPA